MRRYRALDVLFLVLASTIFVSACHAMSPTVADRCILIDVHGVESRDLIPLLDSFSDRYGLVADKSHPISPSYERRHSGEVLADLTYTIGIGRFGAELALFRFDRERSVDLVEAFDSLVKELERKYKVTKCGDVPDYEMPVVYK